jgi:hypothetical protein
MRVITVVLGTASPLGATHMDAYLSDSPDLSYSDRAAVLITASSDAAMRRAERTIEAAGLRVGARMPVEQAACRIQEQARASALWVELDQDCGGAMDMLLGQISRDVADGRYAAVVSATAALVDPLCAMLGDNDVEVIVDAD